MRKANLDKPGRENWISDVSVTKCSQCAAAFGLLTRKHHCRVCGNIFCAKCSSFEIRYTPHTRKGESSYTEKKKRVCEACFQTIGEARRRAEEVKREAEAARTETLALRDQIRRGAVSVTLDELTNLQVQLREKDGRAVELAEAQDVAEQEQRRLESCLRERRSTEDSTAEAAAEEGEDDFGSLPLPTVPGVYLIYEQLDNGTISAVWSRDEVEGALAYGRPGKKVPDFKYADGGKWELYREVEGNDLSYYMGWTMFVRICSQFKCSIVDYGIADRSAPIPITLWLHLKDSRAVQRILPGMPFTTDGVDAVASLPRDDTELDVGRMERGQFVQKSKNTGHVIALF
mmetsp:Transcript_88332/g.250351  ORF Transcript_88332/g.250351 Transcript_88332/m.250351 type:complete len:345 (+) Transcript_88332:45-1079(+)